MSDAGAETGYPGDPAPARLNLTELVIGGAAPATDGYRIFHGRADDVMNPMGYRVSPTEVEDCLARHASVAEWE